MPTRVEVGRCIEWRAEYPLRNATSTPISAPTSFDVTADGTHLIVGVGGAPGNDVITWPWCEYVGAFSWDGQSNVSFGVPIGVASNGECYRGWQSTLPLGTHFPDSTRLQIVKFPNYVGEQTGSPTVLWESPYYTNPTANVSTTFTIAYNALDGKMYAINYQQGVAGVLFTLFSLTGDGVYEELFDYNSNTDTPHPSWMDVIRPGSRPCIAADGAIWFTSAQFNWVYRYLDGVLERVPDVGYVDIATFAPGPRVPFDWYPNADGSMSTQFYNHVSSNSPSTRVGKRINPDFTVEDDSCWDPPFEGPQSVAQTAAGDIIVTPFNLGRDYSGWSSTDATTWALGQFYVPSDEEEAVAPAGWFVGVG